MALRPSTFDQIFYLLSMSLVPTALNAKSNPKPTGTKWARMRFRFLMLFTFHFSLLIFNSCGLDIEDPTPPSPPVWVQKSLPEEWPERGIDAHESGGIFLEWESNTEENITAYLLFSAKYYPENDSLGDYELLKNNISASQLSYLHSKADIRVRYFYKIKAEDSAGNYSVFSNSIGYALLPRIDFETMNPNGINDTLKNDRLLNWRFSISNEMENYCLTLLTSNDDFIMRVQFSPSDYVNGQESWQIPESVTLDSGRNYKWRIELGSQYIDDMETFGSESLWSTFLYSK